MDKEKLKKIKEIRKKRKKKKTKTSSPVKKADESLNCSQKPKKQLKEDAPSLPSAQPAANSPQPAVNLSTEEAAKESREAVLEIQEKIKNATDDFILSREKVTNLIVEVLSKKRSLNQQAQAFLTIEILKTLSPFILKNKSLDLGLCFWAREYWEAITLNKIEDPKVIDVGLKHIHDYAVKGISQFKVDNMEFIQKIINKNFDEDVLQALFGFKKNDEGHFVQDQSGYKV